MFLHSNLSRLYVTCTILCRTFICPKYSDNFTPSYFVNLEKLDFENPLKSTIAISKFGSHIATWSTETFVQVKGEKVNMIKLMYNIYITEADIDLWKLSDVLLFFLNTNC